MQFMLEPQDYRDVLVIARARSLKAAAAELRIDASTIGRRLDGIEARFGARIFLRARRGLEVTPDGVSLVAAAEKMEALRHAFERELLAQRPELASGLTVTSAEWGIPLLTPILGALARSHPTIPVRLRFENRALDLARREADVALRIGRPDDDALTGRRLGVVTYGLYGSSDYLRRCPAPRTRDAASTHDFVALDEHLAGTPQMRWQANIARDARVVFRTNSMLSLVEAVASGHGLATLPCLLADRRSGLVRVLHDLDVVERDVWLVFHRDLRRSRSLRPFVDGLVARVKPLFARPR